MSWWLEKYDTKKDSYKSYKSSYTGSSWWKSSYKSATKGWMDKLGGFGWFDFDYKGKEDKTKRLYRKVLNQLQTSINVISGEKNLNVRWSDGDNQNSPDSPIVYISPDSLIDEGENIVEDTIDVLTGKVYLSSVLNKQISKDDYNIANLMRNRIGRDPLYAPTVKLWEALETNIAKKFIEDNWCGFMPHIVKHGEAIKTKKETVQNFIDNTSKTSPNLEAAIAGISWNLTSPEDTVILPKVYENCVEAAVDILEDPETENKRFNTCQRIVRKIQEILLEQEAESQGDNQNDECGDEGKDSEQISKEINQKPEDGEKPAKKVSKSKLQKDFENIKLTDGELFGSKVKNITDETIAHIKSNKDESGDGGTTGMNGVDLSGLKNEFVVPDVREIDRDGEAYESVVLDLKPCINTIKNTFCSINNKLFLNSYGHNSGDIDENNLHKIFLGDDRMMQKRDIISQKKISICLLIDESGSMQDKDVDARNTAIALAEGLKNYFDVSVYGHTAELNVKGCTITEYFTPRNKFIQTCMDISAKCENVDGLAIELVAKKFIADYPESRRIIFVISDGEPASTYYGGSPAIEHVNNVCEMIRNRMDTEVYGIGICEAYDDDTGEALYDKGNYVVLEDVTSSIGIITRFLKQICNKNTRVLS